MLDGLNHVKDHLDPTLSFRWSCRMGICGSCGMNVNGEPRLTCGTFLSDYAPGPVRVEPLANFPVVRDLVVDMSDFMEKLPRVKPWIIRDDDVTEIDGEYLQTPEELDAYKQFSMCINCMLCYAACPVYGLDPDFIGPAAIALAERYDLDSRDDGARERLDVLVEHDGVWACTFVGECSAVCPKHVDPAGGDPALQAQGRPGVGQGVPAAPRCAMSAPRPAAHGRPRLPAADLDVVVAPEAVLLRVRDARAEQPLHRLVRGLPAADAAQRHGSGRRRTPTSSTGRPRRWVVGAQRRGRGLPRAPRGDLVQPHAEGDAARACGGRPVPPVAIIAAPVRRAGGRVRPRGLAGDPMTHALARLAAAPS